MATTSENEKEKRNQQFYKSKLYRLLNVHFSCCICSISMQRCCKCFYLSSQFCFVRSDLVVELQFSNKNTPQSVQYSCIHIVDGFSTFYLFRFIVFSRVSPLNRSIQLLFHCTTACVCLRPIDFYLKTTTPYCHIRHMYNALYNLYAFYIRPKASNIVYIYDALPTIKYGHEIERNGEKSVQRRTNANKISSSNSSSENIDCIRTRERPLNKYK